MANRAYLCCLSTQLEDRRHFSQPSEYSGSNIKNSDSLHPSLIQNCQKMNLLKQLVAKEHKGGRLTHGVKYKTILLDCLNFTFDALRLEQR